MRGPFQILISTVAFCDGHGLAIHRFESRQLAELEKEEREADAWAARPAQLHLDLDMDLVDGPK